MVELESHLLVVVVVVEFLQVVPQTSRANWQICRAGEVVEGYELVADVGRAVDTEKLEHELTNYRVVLVVVVAAVRIDPFCKIGRSQLVASIALA